MGSTGWAVAPTNVVAITVQQPVLAPTYPTQRVEVILLGFVTSCTPTAATSLTIAANSTLHSATATAPTYTPATSTTAAALRNPNQSLFSVATTLQAAPVEAAATVAVDETVAPYPVSHRTTASTAACILDYHRYECIVGTSWLGCHHEMNRFLAVF